MKAGRVVLCKLEDGFLAQARVTSYYQGHFAQWVRDVARRVEGHAFEEAEHGTEHEQRYWSTQNMHRVDGSCIEVSKTIAQSI